MGPGSEGRIFRYGVVESTNELALCAIEAGEARHGDVHLAVGQTAGRGRLGRRWESAPGEGLYLTLVVRPGGVPPAGALTLAGGLAVRDACAALGAVGCRLDWPNDVVAGGAKLAGVLTESRGLDPQDPAWALGVGWNVAQRSFPPALAAERAVTSLALLGVATTAAAAEGALLAALGRRVEGALAAPDALFRDAFEALLQGGEEVRVEAAGRSHRGRFVALEPARGLCLETAKRRWLPLAHVRSVELE